MLNPFRRPAASNLVWIAGVAAGVVAGAIVAYGVATTARAVATRSN